MSYRCSNCVLFRNCSEICDEIFDEGINESQGNLITRGYCPDCGTKLSPPNLATNSCYCNSCRHVFILKYKYERSRYLKSYVSSFYGMNTLINPHSVVKITA